MIFIPAACFSSGSGSRTEARQRSRLAKILRVGCRWPSEIRTFYSPLARARLPDFDDRLGIARALPSQLLASLGLARSVSLARDRPNA